MKIKPHIELLVKAEESKNIRFNRTGADTISVSCFGYEHADLHEIEKQLLQAGCRYDFGKGITEYDKVGNLTVYRTYRNFIEPKGEWKHVCPYCGSEVGYEPVLGCCGEVHGEWEFVTE